ncbi:hypothetical protein CNMCM6936_005320 [Aspergillus lentulus]|nr:hypothetical protein CNMCM6936_005320 [Aspergillus lentulus]KAF4191361.1 hypothetical protein CNMCM8694_002018 [Aspergillus lentulus]GFF58027.1 protein kinase domain containing protein [Aspergillus lentulus]
MVGIGPPPTAMPVMEVTASAPECAKGDGTADFSDFVSNEDEELDLEEVVEPWHKYHMNDTSHVFYLFLSERCSMKDIW